MARLTRGYVGARLGVVVVLVLASGWAEARAGGGRRARARAIVPTTVERPLDVAPSPMRGTFNPTPYITVLGDWPVGNGYSPLDQYGEDQAMSLYGPLSSFRPRQAPIALYARGYNGALVPTVGTTTSYPNLPQLSPVVYPTHANSYYFPRRPMGTPPWWQDGTNWIDMN